MRLLSVPPIPRPVVPMLVQMHGSAPIIVERPYVAKDGTQRRRVEVLGRIDVPVWCAATEEWVEGSDLVPPGAPPK